VRGWRSAIAGAILLFFAAWVVWYVWRHAHEFTILAGVPLRYLAWLYLFTVALVYCNGLYIKIILQAFGVNLRWPEWMSLAVTTSVLNFLTPMRGGAAMRAMYLKARYRFSITDFVSTLSATYLMYVVIHGLIGLAGMVLLWRKGLAFDLPLAAFFGVAVLGSAVLMLCPITTPPWKTAPFKQIADILKGWTSLRRNRPAFVSLMAASAAFALFSAMNVKVASRAVEVDFSWGAVLFYTAGNGMALVVTITPAALGIAEFVSIYMGQALNYNTSQALMIQALLRAVPLTFLLVTGPIAFRILGVGLSGEACGTARRDVVTPVGLGETTDDSSRPVVK